MKIILYSIEKCRECEIVKEKLDDLNIKYEVFDDWDKIQDMGMNLVPVLEVNGKRIYHEELETYNFKRLQMTQKIIDFCVNQRFGYGRFDDMQQAEDIVYYLEHGMYDKLGELTCPPEEFVVDMLCETTDVDIDTPNTDRWKAQVDICTKCWSKIFE